MKKNETAIVTIEDMGINGEGIGKAGGYPLFVKDAVIGDVVEVKVTKAKKQYAYARLMKILTPSKDRVPARCPVAKQCGGCQIQELSYEKQLEFKMKKVRGNLERIGGFSAELLDAVMDPIAGMDDPFAYRNKAQFPVGVDREGNLISGFYAGRTHTIIPHDECALGVPVNAVILREVLDYMKKCGVSAYNEETGEGLVRHVMIRYGFTTKEIMVCLVINGDVLPKSRELLSRLEKIEGMKSISVSINKEKGNVIMGREVRVLWGHGHITDYIGDICYRISPLSFYQVNPVQTNVLYRLALDYADLHGEETVWDLYCGIGTISLFLAGQCRQVYGVEIVPQAIADAKENAMMNHITNAEFFVGKAEEILPQYYIDYEKKYGEKAYADVIVVDPPRKGCDEALLETMVQMEPKRIVYVSCDSATLSRDLRMLCDNGYELRKAQAVDMFPMTGHVETVVLLSKGDIDSKKIKVEFSLEDMDMSEFQNGATYEQIKEYVLCETGLKVSSLYISQMKRKCGLEVGKNYNMAKSEDAKQPQCPKEKEQAIMDAFKHFGMI